MQNNIHDFLSRISEAGDEQTLEIIRIEALGKQGAITAQLKGLGSLSVHERKLRGAEINQIRDQVQAALAERKSYLKRLNRQAKLAAEKIDVSLQVRQGAETRGRIHPVSQVIDEITAIFADMGFSLAEGPEIETDFYNFTALNFPEGHPAREMHDTFFMNANATGQRKVLRTHTSPVQIRTMEAVQPPIRVIIPGRTYRNDSDQTHTPMFHQLEGLVIDKSAHMGHMKWVLENFLKAFFEVEHLKMRFRPSFFPFTEPSMEADILCSTEDGELRIGQGTKWMEILGCGMVHPKVLQNCGLDPDMYQGFAWGMGIDRIAMLKYGMPDLRAFFDADIRWLKHYGFRPLDLPTLFGGISQASHA